MPRFNFQEDVPIANVQPDNLDIDQSWAEQYVQAGRNVSKAISTGTSKALSYVLPEGAAETGGNIAAGLVPTDPRDQGQIIGAAAGGALGAITGPAAPIAVPALSIAGGALGRMSGSLFHDEPNLAGQGTLGALTSMVPFGLKGLMAGGRTILARMGKNVTVSKAVDYINNMLPVDISPLSKDTAVLSRQLSKGTKESILDQAQKQYNIVMDGIKQHLGSSTIIMPSLSRNPITISRVIQAIERMGTGMTRSAGQRTGAANLALLRRQEIINEFDSVLRQYGLGSVANAYSSARNNYARVNEVARLFTRAAKNDRPLNLKAGEIDLSNLQANFLNRRETGRLADAFRPSEIQGLESSLARGGNLVGIDVPSNIRGVLSFFYGRTGGRGGISGVPTLPRASGVNYNPPGIINRAYTPTLLTPEGEEE